MAFSGTLRANASQDVDVLDLPTDSISSIQFSPVADFLAVGSWDNSVIAYELLLIRRDAKFYEHRYACTRSAQMVSHKEKWCCSTQNLFWACVGIRYSAWCDDLLFLSLDRIVQGTHVFSGGADGAGRMLDVETGQAMQVAQHDATIRVVKWVDAPGSGVLATGSWDKTIKARPST